MKRHALVFALAAVATFVLPLHEASAQKNRVGGMEMPRGGGGGHGGVYRGGGGGGGGGWGRVGAGLGIGIVSGIILSQPAAGAVEDAPPQRVQRANQPQRGNQPQRAQRSNQTQRTARGSGAPPAGETRLVPDEVVIELSNSASAATINAIRQRHRLTQLESQRIVLTNTTFFRWRIPDRRSVTSVVRALESDTRVASAQPNYRYTLQQDGDVKLEANVQPADQADSGESKLQAAETKAKFDPLQYAVLKMRLDEAHGLAKGDNVLVAVIDSAIDPSHPELIGAVADTFDAVASPFKPHDHGTGIAALIVGRERLRGAAPGARILAVRAFDPAGSTAEATTFSILKGLDWSVAKGARVINMSFAGPADPAISRSLAAAQKKAIVLIAAAGNAGPKSPPLYPAADPNVIAVTATDSTDKLFAGSNRGRHIAVAAPGVDVLIAVPNGGYHVSTGTSFSAAQVSGTVALMLQRKGNLTPAQVRDTLLATANDLGPTGRDDDFGAGLTDAYRALTDGMKTSAARPQR
jgi:subtilisin family serine protease